MCSIQPPACATVRQATRDTTARGYRAKMAAPSWPANACARRASTAIYARYPRQAPRARLCDNAGCRQSTESIYCNSALHLIFHLWATSAALKMPYRYEIYLLLNKNFADVIGTDAPVKYFKINSLLLQLLLSGRAGVGRKVL